MTAHTPGPWTAPSCGIFAATGERIAAIEPLRCPVLKANGGTRNVEMAANARLIAAAPAMLEALRIIARDDSDRLNESVLLIANQELARQAIAAATE